MVERHAMSNSDWHRAIENKKDLDRLERAVGNPSPVFAYTDGLPAPTILDRNPEFATAYAEQLAKAPTSRTTEALRTVGRTEGDVYLNISKVDGLSPESIARNPAFQHSVDMFSGPHAAEAARRDVEDAEDQRDPAPHYVTTIVLHPTGEWEEVYLFRL